jgi:hypothetical protein
MIQANPDLKAIFVTNDGFAQGCRSGRQRGRQVQPLVEECSGEPLGLEVSLGRYRRVRVELVPFNSRFGAAGRRGSPPRG